MNIKSRGRAWRRLKRHRLGLAAGTVLLLLILGIIFANLLPHGWRKDYNCKYIPPFSYCDDKLFLFGTDINGRDLLIGILKGGGVTLSIAVIVVATSLLLGTLLGCASGYYRGFIDEIIQGLVGIAMSIPRLALLVALSFIIIKGGIIKGWGQELNSFIGILLVLSIVSWAPIARVVRGQVLALREEEFILAAKAIGMGDLQIIIRHIIPNILGYLTVTATLLIPEIVILESVLSYFGYGVRGELISWGNLLTENGAPLDFRQLQPYPVGHPWLFIPALFIFITVLALNVFGDALRDALEVRH